MALRAALALALAGATLAVPVTFNNTAPRLDVNGEIVDLHDSSIARWVNETSGEVWYVAHGVG
jgi:hypothetical protein